MAALHARSLPCFISVVTSPDCLTHPATERPTSSTTAIRPRKLDITGKERTGTRIATATAVTICRITRAGGLSPMFGADVPQSLSSEVVTLCTSLSGVGGDLGDANSGGVWWRRSGSRLEPGLANRGLLEAAELWLPARLPCDRRLCRMSQELPCMVPGIGVTIGSSLMRRDCRYSCAT